MSSSENPCNVASLEHCYTNLFSLIDLTGIKWLRLRERRNKARVDEANKVSCLVFWSLESVYQELSNYTTCILYLFKVKDVL